MWVNPRVVSDMGVKEHSYISTDNRNPSYKVLCHVFYTLRSQKFNIITIGFYNNGSVVN
jgi:hypothetical protein